TKKDIFPHSFVNENNLNYIGEVPLHHHFPNELSYDEYSQYNNQFNGNWNLRNEAINYCQIDCVSLFQVINKYNDLIWELFKISAIKYPTISSLTFNIWKTHYIDRDTVPMISGDIEKNIRA